MSEINLELLQTILKNKKFFIGRGIPLTKKLWRDGYNKALSDIENAVLIELQAGAGVGETSQPDKQVVSDKKADAI